MAPNTTIKACSQQLGISQSTLSKYKECGALNIEEMGELYDNDDHDTDIDDYIEDERTEEEKDIDDLISPITRTAKRTYDPRILDTDLNVKPRKRIDEGQNTEQQIKAMLHNMMVQINEAEDGEVSELVKKLKTVAKALRDEGTLKYKDYKGVKIFCKKTLTPEKKE